MGCERQECLLSFSVEEPSESTLELTRNLTDLVGSIQPSPFVCAVSKIYDWRKGQEVSFTREEMDKHGAFLKTDNLIPRHEELSDGAIDQAELAVPELSALSVPEESRRNKKGTEVKKGERKKKCVSNTAKAKRKVRSEVRKNGDREMKWVLNRKKLDKFPDHVKQHVRGTCEVPWCFEPSKIGEDLVIVTRS